MSFGIAISVQIEPLKKKKKKAQWEKLGYRIAVLPNNSPVECFSLKEQKVSMWCGHLFFHTRYTVSSQHIYQNYKIYLNERQKIKKLHTVDPL